MGKRSRRIMQAQEAARATPNPEEMLQVQDTLIALKRMLEGLRPKERRVISLIFGFGGGKSHNLKETAAIMHVSPEYVRQLRNEAIRKLKHPSLSKFLKAATGRKVPRE